MNSSTQLTGSMAHQTQNRPSIFILPPEVRNTVYWEVLVVPGGGVARSLAPPALLHTNRRLRDETSPIFYSKNRFEITIKRSAKDEALAGGRRMPCIDSCVWSRFLHMWDVFRCNTANYLQQVEHITLIYELSMDNGWSFGEDEFDKRLGFRFSSKPFDECHDGNNEEDGNSDSPEEEKEGSNEEMNDESTNENEESGPEEDSDQVGAFELNRGDFDWPSRRETHFFLFNTMADYDTDQLWSVYPIERLTTMLWRCVRDCPLASKNVDFICDDHEYWLRGHNPYTGYDPSDFYDPDDEDEL